MRTAYHTVITDIARLETLYTEWEALFAGAPTASPFAHPLWQIAWARHFVAPGMLHVITARTREGDLIGVAPFYRRQRVASPGLMVTQLRLLGTGPHGGLTELPHILARPDPTRKVLQDMMRFLSEQTEGWDWIQVALTPSQGWLEPSWLPSAQSGEQPHLVQGVSKPCVVLPLPPSWDELRGRLKRNVKESIRRGTNRLSRAGHTWDVVVPDSTPALRQALDTLMDLHRRRAQLQGKPLHPDYFADSRERAFLRDVSERMHAAGLLTPYVLRVGQTPVAARLLLRAHGTCFFSVSGLDPTWWHFGPGTTLMVECLKAELTQGAVMANLSPGLDVSKLRWSEELEVHNDFFVVNPRWRSRLALQFYRRHHDRVAS